MGAPRAIPATHATHATGDLAVMAAPIATHATHAMGAIGAAAGGATMTTAEAAALAAPTVGWGAIQVACHRGVAWMRMIGAQVGARRGAAVSGCAPEMVGQAGRATMIGPTTRAGARVRRTVLRLAGRALVAGMMRGRQHATEWGAMMTWRSADATHARGACAPAAWLAG